MIAAVPILVFDLASSDGGLIEGGQTGQWEWGTPTMGPVGLGDCWATSLTGPYLHDSVDTIEVPLPDLTGLTRPVVVVRHFYDIVAGDLGRVEVDPGTGFLVLDPVQGYPVPGGIAGTSASYEELAFDLTGLGPTPRFRLSFQSDPAVAAPGWFVQEVVLWDGDIVAPEITAVSVPADTQDLDGPYPVQMHVTDDVGLASVSLSYAAGGEAPATVPMVHLGSGLWEADIPGQPADTLVTFTVAADDGSQVGLWPEAGAETFRVFLAAPTDLTGPQGSHNIGTSALLTWTPPVSPHPVLHYEVHQEGVASVVIVTDDNVTMPLDPEVLQQFDVRARYDVGIGDASEPVVLDVEIPDLIAVDPDTAFQGDLVYVQLSGASLYLIQEQATLNLGPGIRTLDLDVRDANAATALVEITAAAEPGGRDVIVGSSLGTLQFPDRFTVQSGADAPGVTSITPPSLRQGDDVRIEVRASQAFAGPVHIDGGDDLVVTGSVDTEADTVTFGLAANTRSRIGDHTLVLDDGARLWTVDIEVEERTFTSQKGCTTSPVGAAGWALWLVAGLLHRRR